MLKLQYFGCVMWRANSLEKILMLGKIEGKRRRGQQRMKWLDSITNSMDMNLSKLAEMGKDREGWHAAVCGAAKSHIWLSGWTTKKLNNNFESVQFEWPAAYQASLFFTISWSFLKFMFIELVMLYNHLIFCCPLLLLPSIFPNIRVFSNEPVLCIRWPKFWSFSFSPSNEYSGLISFRID